LKLLQRAVRERWPIPEAERAKLPRWLLEIVADPDLDVRGRVGAAKVIAELDKLNMAQEQADAGGAQVRLDVTSGGKPLGQPHLSTLSDDDLERLIAEKERGLPG